MRLAWLHPWGRGPTRAHVHAHTAAPRDHHMRARDVQPSSGP